MLYKLAHEIVLDAIFVTALLLAIAYAQWHYWWRSWFGRSFMVLLLALAGIRLQVVTGELGLHRGDETGAVLDWIGLTASAFALVALFILLWMTLSFNVIQPARRGTAADETRRYLEQTPGITGQEIKELLACWDHLRQLRDLHSDASDQPAQETP